MLDCYEFWLLSEGCPFEVISSTLTDLDLNPDSTSHEDESNSEIRIMRKKRQAILREQINDLIQERKSAAQAIQKGNEL